MKWILYILCFSVFVSCQYSNKNTSGYDIRLFRNTPVWGLAKAVKSEDTVKMRKLIEKNKLNVDYQEPKFGKTLLMLAAHNQWISSARVLLESGANPNLPDRCDYTNAVINASGWGPDYEDNPDLLKLLLKYGGDPNYVAIPDRVGNTMIKTPLIVAAGCSFAKTKILVEAGANINYLGPWHGSAIGAAALMDRPESPYILKYLLDNGGDCNTITGITISGNTLRLVNDLRTWLYPLDSEQYRIKMEIVKMLEECGQDYWNTPIPKDYYKYYDEEYLSQY